MKVWEGGDRVGAPVGIGIDQSYTGFAVAAVSEFGYRVTVYKGRGTGIDRLLDIEEHLRKELSQYIWIIDMAMEGYAYAATNGAPMAGELGAIVKRSLRVDFTPPRYPLIITPGQLKKFATGNGNAKKQQIMLAVFKKWGVELINDNAADAYVLARIAAGLADTKYEQDVLASVRREG